MKVVSAIIGGQIGSEGKGKIAGYIACKDNIKYAINNFFPNAGHTWKLGKNKVVVHQLPIALVNKNTQLLIGPAAAVDLDKLIEEINTYDSQFKVRERLKISPRAVVVQKYHREQEKKDSNLLNISSTQTGGAAAYIEKIMRKSSVKLCRDEPELTDFIAQNGTDIILHNAIDSGESIVIEGAQGFELDINHGFDFPHCTSRQTNLAQMVADCGIPIDALKNIYCVIRPFPIRVGGQSGPWSKQELRWEDIEQNAGMPIGHLKEKEYSTTTHKRRRVFAFDFERLKLMVKIYTPSDFCLNHVDYINHKDFGIKQFKLLSNESQQFIKKIENETDVPVTLIGTGPDNEHIIDRRKER
ncbi:adenylosuccinate synthetase [Heliobacterium chlorum]|uniref:Adenylosuccinate synthetase n=1 Tax=Heliobacterium chlorum TaxID=2698 RepID=A0ABR7T4I2_HELCL|nr:adenylosuccinate synthetase [Heliobacterium chlorum]MBC9784987.1 adenylosuccinate synthetase [Heliobacterium chlorum]